MDSLNGSLSRHRTLVRPGTGYICIYEGRRWLEPEPQALKATVRNSHPMHDTNSEQTTRVQGAQQSILRLPRAPRESTRRCRDAE